MIYILILVILYCIFSYGLIGWVLFTKETRIKNEDITIFILAPILAPIIISIGIRYWYTGKRPNYEDVE